MDKIISKQNRIKLYSNKLSSRHYMRRYMKHYRKKALKHLQETVWQLIAYQLDYKVKVPYHWEYIVGWNVIQLAKHLQSKFYNGMKWSSYGKLWELDHIIPRSKFKFDSYNDKGFRKLWQLENLQPLLRIHNRQKFTKSPEEWIKYKKEHNIEI